MFSITLKRSVATIGVVAGLLAAAVPASAQGGGADFTRFEEHSADRLLGSQRGLINNGTGDDQMKLYTQQGQVLQQGRASPQAYMTDVIWQDNFVRTVVTDVIWQDTVD